MGIGELDKGGLFVSLSTKIPMGIHGEWGALTHSTVTRKLYDP